MANFSILYDAPIYNRSTCDAIILTQEKQCVVAVVAARMGHGRGKIWILWTSFASLQSNRSTMTYLPKNGQFPRKGTGKSTGTNIIAEKEIKILLQVANTSLLLTSKSQPLNYCYGPSSNLDIQTLSHTITTNIWRHLRNYICTWNTAAEGTLERLSKLENYQ